MTRETSFSARPFSAFSAFKPSGDGIASNCLAIHKADSESGSKVLKMLYLRDVENVRPSFILSFFFFFF